MVYDDLDREIIKFLQGNIPLESRPYKKLAERLNLTEEEVVLHIREMQNKGLIRRLGAILRHQQAGYKVNALVAWKVEDILADEIGQTMAGFKEISHCYLREVPENFGHNLFTMIHTHNDEELNTVVDRISRQIGIKDFLIIKSVKELKKTSMVYF